MQRLENRMIDVMTRKRSHILRDRQRQCREAEIQADDSDTFLTLQTGEMVSADFTASSDGSRF